MVSDKESLKEKQGKGLEGGGAIMEAIVIKDEGESLIIFLLGRERIFQGSLELGTRTPYVGYRPLLLTNFGDNFSFSPLVFAIICPQCSI